MVPQSLWQKYGSQVWSRDDWCGVILSVSLTETKSHCHMVWPSSNTNKLCKIAQMTDQSQKRSLLSDDYWVYELRVICIMTSWTTSNRPLIIWFSSICCNGLFLFSKGIYSLYNVTCTLWPPGGICVNLKSSGHKLKPTHQLEAAPFGLDTSLFLLQIIIKLE